MVWRWGAHMAEGQGWLAHVRPVGVVGPLGRWCAACGLTWKMACGRGPTWWSGPHGKFEFKLKHEFEFGKDLKEI
jgi:hypothetical protein